MTKLKQIGKILKTEDLITECECGELVHQRSFKSLNDNAKSWEEEPINNGLETLLGFCKCGNIIMSDPPSEIVMDIKHGSTHLHL